MNFELSDEQAMIKETVGRLLADYAGLDRRRRDQRQAPGWSRSLWMQLAEMGVLAAPFAEVDGGLDGGPVETLLVAEALGRSLAGEPYLASIVLAGTALRLSDAAALRAKVLPGLIGGEIILAAALEGPPITASRSPAGWRLEGRANNVLHGDCADGIVLAVASVAGPLVVLAAADAPGLERRPYRTFDGLRAAELTLNGVEIPAEAVLAQGEAGERLIERALQHAVAFVAAEAVGIMEMLLEITLEHLKMRKQFGQPLSKFQALQHRAAEMLVSLEQARSMALYAAMMTNVDDAAERRKAFSAVKAVISTSGRFVGQNAVQLHGGLGVTEEHRAGWGLRRLTMIDMLFGDADVQVARLADLGGFVPAA